MDSSTKKMLKAEAKSIYDSTPNHYEGAAIGVNDFKSNIDLFIERPFTTAYQVLCYHKRIYVGFGQAECMPNDKWRSKSGINRASGKCRGMIINKLYRQLCKQYEMEPIPAQVISISYSDVNAQYPIS